MNSIRLFLTFILSLLFYNIFPNLTVYFNYGTFSTSNSKPYLETYLTISGNSVKFAPITNGFQASVNVSWKIMKDTSIIKSANYNLKSPVISDTLQTPSFIDNQRFSLDNGIYNLVLIVTDNANPSKTTKHSEKITILFNRDKKIYTSDIQILESYAKTNVPSILTKSGYNLIPYNINYFPKKQTAIKFYMETYNLDTLIGNGSKFMFNYYIENKETLRRLDEFSGFKKQTSNKVNPLLAQFDITALSSGNYNLVIEARDSLNQMLSQKKWFFQRQNDIESLSGYENGNFRSLETFFNSVQDADSLKQMVECLWPISSYKEREWQQTQATKKDPALMRSYLTDYWKKEAADTANPLKLWFDYYKLVLETNALLKCGKQKGYYTDRGRVYLQYGKPDQRNQVNSEPETYPYEIWQYYRIYDKATKRFFTNKKFVFANFMISDDCYKLIHSEVRGEVYDERWQLRLVDRSQQKLDFDQTKPEKYYGNNIDENFSNPR